MLSSVGVVWLVIFSWIHTTLAHTVQLQSHARECFHEQLHRDDQMTVTFQVGDREFGSSGNLDINFWVCLESPKALPVLLDKIPHHPLTRCTADHESLKSIRTQRPVSVIGRLFFQGETGRQIHVLF